jgi:hypothetical protein
METKHCNWRGWRDFFAARSDRPRPRILEDDPALAGIPPSVARSLAIFQLGESGGDSVVQQARSSRLPGVDSDYGDAMSYFVAEEHRHAELLACCVRVLRGQLLQANWTARLFVVGRRLMGLRLKVMVLLAAEIVGICYYNLLASRLPEGNLSTLLREIEQDEKAHLRFHCRFLRSQVNSAVSRLVFTAAWRTLMLAAAVVVLIDHRHALHDLEIAPADAWRRWMVYSRTAEGLITGQGLAYFRRESVR